MSEKRLYEELKKRWKEKENDFWKFFERQFALSFLLIGVFAGIFGSFLAGFYFKFTENVTNFPQYIHYIVCVVFLISFWWLMWTIWTGIKRAEKSMLITTKQMNEIEAKKRKV